MSVFCVLDMNQASVFVRYWYSRSIKWAPARSHTLPTRFTSLRVFGHLRVAVFRAAGNEYEGPQLLKARAGLR